MYIPKLQPLNHRTHRDVTFEGFHSGDTEDRVFWYETFFIGANIFSKFRKILVPPSSEPSSLLDIPDTAYEGTAIRRMGTRWRSQLGHRATSRKSAGSIPDDVIERFH